MRRSGSAAAFCVFEYIYFARPDSRMNGQVLQVARGRMGEILWREAPVEADLVIAVPDSGNPAARGLARAAGLPQDDGFVKNRYVARTFIQPGQELRKHGLRLKFNPLPEVIAGKRLVVVDDSIVRGNTTRQIVQMLRDAGAAEIHMRISAPPIKHPCHYGIDMSSREEMIAHERTTEQIAAELGCDSLHYLSLEGVYEAVARHPRESLRRLLHRRVPARGQRLRGRQVLARAGRGGPHGQRRRGPGAGRPQRHRGRRRSHREPGRDDAGRGSDPGSRAPRPPTSAREVELPRGGGVVVDVVVGVVDDQLVSPLSAESVAQGGDDDQRHGDGQHFGASFGSGDLEAPSRPSPPIEGAFAAGLCDVGHAYRFKAGSPLA